MIEPARKCLAALLAACLLAPATLYGQTDSLQIRVLSGEGAIHDIEDRVVLEPEVEVVGADGQPVKGANVTFRAPIEGPGATFYGASPTMSVNTDEKGRARAVGMIPNTHPGPFAISVQAEHEGRTAATEIAQNNILPPAEQAEKKRRFGWKIYTLIGVAVGAAIAALVLGGEGDALPVTPAGSTGAPVGTPR